MNTPFDTHVHRRKHKFLQCGIFLSGEVVRILVAMLHSKMFDIRDAIRSVLVEVGGLMEVYGALRRIMFMC